MNDEVSVAELLEREGWGRRVPPRPGSRLRMLAVMGAVVFGCGAAAFVVSMPGGEQDRGLEDPVVTRTPERTWTPVRPEPTGTAEPGPATTSSTTPSPATVSSSEEPDPPAGGHRGGSGATVVPTSATRPAEPTGEPEPEPSESSSPVTPAPPTSTEPTCDRWPPWLFC